MLSFGITDLSKLRGNFEASGKASLSTRDTPLSALYGQKLTFAEGGGKLKPNLQILSASVLFIEMTKTF